MKKSLFFILLGVALSMHQAAFSVDAEAREIANELKKTTEEFEDITAQVVSDKPEDKFNKEELKQIHERAQAELADVDEFAADLEPAFPLFPEVKALQGSLQQLKAITKEEMEQEEGMMLEEPMTVEMSEEAMTTY